MPAERESATRLPSRRSVRPRYVYVLCRPGSLRQSLGEGLGCTYRAPVCRGMPTPRGSADRSSQSAGAAIRPAISTGQQLAGRSRLAHGPAGAVQGGGGEGGVARGGPRWSRAPPGGARGAASSGQQRPAAASV